MPRWYRLGWQSLTCHKMRSKLEATQHPSSKSPQQTQEEQQRKRTCSWLTAIFLLLCLSIDIVYTFCWLPSPVIITDRVSAMGLLVGSQGKTCSFSASHPTFYPPGCWSPCEQPGLGGAGLVCGLTENLPRQFILMRICLLKKIIQTILNKIKLFFSSNRPLLPRLLDVNSFPCTLILHVLLHFN